SFEDETPLLVRKLTPRDVGWNAAAARPFLEFGDERAIARLRPGLDDAFIERLARIGHDEIQIEVDGVTKALAARTCAIWIVERKKARLRNLIDRAIVFAFEPLVENEALRLVTSFIRQKFENGFAEPFAIADFDRIDEPRAGFGIDGKPI